jgi:hypothetical protein
MGEMMAKKINFYSEEMEADKVLEQNEVLAESFVSE